MKRAVPCLYRDYGMIRGKDLWVVWFPGHRAAVVMPDEGTARVVAEAFNSRLS